MRKTIAAVTVLVALLATASVALATLTQTATVLLTAHKANQSTGITATMRSSDASAPGGKPTAATGLVIGFPAGTKFNLIHSLAARCHYTDAQLVTRFGPTCPKKSQVGSGRAVANASPLANPVNAVVAAYVRSATEMVFVVKPTLPGAPTIVIHAAVHGSRLTMPIPRINLGGIAVVLVSLTLDVPKLGNGKHALIISGRCVARAFSVTSHFTYADGSTLNFTSSAPCR